MKWKILTDARFNPLKYNEPVRFTFVYKPVYIFYIYLRAWWRLY